MGMPLSRFSYFKEICNESFFTSKLSRFKLIAVVLHDPEDQQFQTVLQNNFARFSAQTGQDFLFISFVRPPANWQCFTGLPEEDSINNLVTSTENDSMMLFAFAKEMGISLENLPCILLTTSLNSNRYICFSTSTDQIDFQLTELGKFCSTREGKVSIKDDEVDELIMNIAQGYSLGSKNRSIAQILLDLYAPVTASMKQYDSTEARRMYMNKLEYLSHKLCTYLSEGLVINAIEQDQQLENIYDDIITQLTLYRSNLKSLPERGITPKEIIGCEEYSKTQCNFFNSALYLQQHQDTLTKDFQLSIDPDLPGKYIGGFLEYEINRSLVQLMREANGVPFPQYYNKVWYSSDNKNSRIEIQTSPRNYVQINDDDKGSLKKIGIGHAYYAYKALLTMEKEKEKENEKEQNKLYHFEEEAYNRLLALINLRNSCTHTEKGAKYISMDDGITYFHEFLRNDFPTWVQIKQRLRGY